MKKAKLTNLVIFLIALIFVTTQVSANDAANTNIENIASDALIKLKLMVGDENGNLNLQTKVTRCEFITLVNRMMAYDNDEKNNSSISVPFKDINQKHWAYGNIITALKHSLIKGYTDNTVRPNNNVSFIEAKTVIIRAFGYEDNINKKWPEGIIEKSKELDLNKNLEIQEDKLLTRGEASVLIYNALTVNFTD